MLVARVRVIAARVADAGEHASAMKDKVTSESLIDRDSADSADILFYREIYLALGFPMSAVGGVSYGFREVLSQADGRFEMRTDASSRRGPRFLRGTARTVWYLIWYTWYTLPLTYSGINK